jgi:hypothetical protein
MRPTEIADILKRVTPTLVQATEHWCGKIKTFDLHALEKTGDEISAYRGYFCCRESSQILEELLGIHGVDPSRFMNVSDESSLMHRFLHDTTSPVDDPMIACPTWRQFFDCRYLKYAIGLLADKNPEISERLFSLQDKVRRNVPFQDDIGKLPATFYGPVGELRKTMEKLFSEIGDVYKLGDDLTEKMLRETLKNYAGCPGQWTRNLPILKDKIEEVAKGKYNPSTTIVNPNEFLAIDSLFKEAAKVRALKPQKVDEVRDGR